MPHGNLDRIAAVPGVQAVSPQLYLSTLIGRLVLLGVRHVPGRLRPADRLHHRSRG